jgi:DNA-binding NarL/FixJ family response regulator
VTLHLTGGDIAALERTSTVLLSPFAFDDSLTWRRAACRAVEACVGGDGSSYAVPLAGERLVAASTDIERALAFLSPPPRWIVEALTVRRRALSLTVADWEELFDVRLLRREPFYQEVVRPHGLMAPLTMLAETGEGPLPAVVSVYFSNERSARSRVGDRKQLLRLLYPAFRAGLDTFMSLRRNSAALTALAEDAAIGVLVLEPAGPRTRENQYLQQLMAREPDRDRVRTEMMRAIRGAEHLRAFGDPAYRPARTHTEIRTGSARYRITATFLSDRSRHASPLSLALVERLDDCRPSKGELSARFSLTPREVEVAMLVPRGLSSREIATVLGISPNTARRHVERLLVKLDVHNRTAAAAMISGR